MASMLNTLSKSNTVNKEGNKIRKGAGSMSKKDNKKKAAKLNPASMQTDEFSSSDGKYIVHEASDNGEDNYSDEEDHDGDTDDLEIVDHLKKPFFTNAIINHVPTVGLLLMTYNQIKIFLGDINSHPSI